MLPVEFFGEIFSNRKTLLCFGGIANALEIPPREFFKVTEGFNCNRVFVRDFAQSWYHRGLPPITHDISSTKVYLQTLLQDHQITNSIVACGNSAGGYGAILFGYLLGVDSILAFSPICFLSKDKRIQLRDSRWDGWDKILAQTKTPQYLNLDNFKDRGTIPLTIYHGQGSPDTEHASLLSCSLSVTVHQVPYVGHGVVKYLRDNRRLKEILKQVLS